MSTQPLEININMAGVEKIHICLNGREYTLTPVTENEVATTQIQSQSLRDYVSQLSGKLKQEGRLRTAETYRCALNALMRFVRKEDISISQIDSALMNSYEHSMKERGLTSNTTSFYMRVLRTIYNRAVDDGLTPDLKPFAHVYTGIAKTIKRAIPLSAIQRLQQLDNLTPHEALARDLFLFSFYTRGMSFIDIAYLRPDNIKQGILTYQRHKTHQQLSMRWEQPMQDIVNRHLHPTGEYLLPIIKRSNGRERGQYRQCQRVVNAVLKDVGRKADITLPLSMYVARHSWASIARSMDVPVSIISDGMGHNSERTTQIYLTSLDSNRLDTVNSDIIHAVTGEK